MSIQKKTKILLVDDHLMFLEGLEALFHDELDMEIVAALPSPTKALNLLNTKMVDIVVLDLSMPEMDGIELNATLKKRFPTIKTLVLSTHNSADKIDQLMKNDVDGYLLKNAEPRILKQAIREIAKGKKCFAEDVKQKYLDSFFSNTRTKKENAHLTTRELEILRLIAMELNTNEIADKLCITTHTVKSHRKSLTAKLNVKNIAGLVRYAIQIGLI